MKSHAFFTRGILFAFILGFICSTFFAYRPLQRGTNVIDPEEFLEWLSESEAQFSAVSEKLQKRYGEQDSLLLKSAYLNYLFSKHYQPKDETRNLYLPLPLCLLYLLLVVSGSMFSRNQEPGNMKIFKQKLKQAKDLEQHLRRTLYEYLTNVKGNNQEKTSTLSKSFVRDNAWQHTFSNVDFAFQDFTQRLQMVYPGITEDQLRLCCLVMTGADTSEIAQQLDITKVNVRQRKTRLRDLMGIKNLKLDLKAVLQEFSQS